MRTKLIFRLLKCALLLTPAAGCNNSSIEDSTTSTVDSTNAFSGQNATHNNVTDTDEMKTDLSGSSYRGDSSTGIGTNPGQGKINEGHPAADSTVR